MLDFIMVFGYISKIGFKYSKKNNINFFFYGGIS